MGVDSNAFLRFSGHRHQVRAGFPGCTASLFLSQKPSRGGSFSPRPGGGGRGGARGSCNSGTLTSGLRLRAGCRPPETPTAQGLADLFGAHTLS